MNDEISKKDGYTFHARYLPAILTAVPFWALLNHIRLEYFSGVFSSFSDLLPYLTQAGFSVAAIFLQIQLNRFLSKEVFERIYFKEEYNKPTTELLLWQNIFYDDDTKMLLHTRIKEHFSISLSNKSEERKNNPKARKQIIIAVSQIRNSLRKNSQQVQHNREYGFVRNLLGGSIVATFFSIVFLIISLTEKNTNLIILGGGMLLIYALPILLSKLLMNTYGYYYAKSLFSQFLSNKLQKGEKQ